jgi:hypothetical protein
MYVQVYSVGTAYNLHITVKLYFWIFVRLQKKLQKKMENRSFRIFYTLTSYPPYLNLGYIPIFLFSLEEREGGGVWEAENWIIILVSGKGEKSLFLLENVVWQDKILIFTK